MKRYDEVNYLINHPDMEIEFIQNKICHQKHCHQQITTCESFQCDKCNEIYCLEHRNYDSHQCKSRCEENKTENIPIDYGRCEYLPCRLKLSYINRIQCNKCEKIFCISHRHDFVHQCINVRNFEK
jgi:hypothetical protein